MEKQICERCNKEFEYNLNPKYPRKYCTECSLIKKAEYAASQSKPKEEVSGASPVQKWLMSNRENSIVSQVLMKGAIEMYNNEAGQIDEVEKYLCEMVQILAKVYKVGVQELEK